MEYINRLSGRQRIWLFGGVCLIAFLILIGVMLDEQEPQIESSAFTVDMTIRQIAPKLKITGKTLARELELSLDVKKNMPLKSLGVQKESLTHVVEHIQGHTSSALKYYLYGAIVLWGWIFLVKIGRPEKMTPKNRKSMYPRIGHHIPLVFAVVTAGFLTGKSPNPMESAVKIFKTMVGLYSDVWIKILAFIFFLWLAVWGNKLICGWACPFGALQELLYDLPFFKKIKRRNLPFAVINTIRGSLFFTMLLLLFGLIGGKKGFVIYHYINPFNLFNLDFETASIVITIIAAILIGLFFYRPFCRLICPFGFLSWIMERVSVYRIKIDYETCIHCDACVKACPSLSTKGILNRKTFSADCFSCSRCLNICPVDAITYGSNFKKRIDSVSLKSANNLLERS